MAFVIIALCVFAFRHVQYFPSRISIFHFMASHVLFVYIKYLLVSLLALSLPLETWNNQEYVNPLKSTVKFILCISQRKFMGAKSPSYTPTKKWRCVKPYSNKNFTYERFHANSKTITNTIRLYLLTVHAIGSTHANCIDIWCRFFPSTREKIHFFFFSYTHIRCLKRVLN